MNVQYSDELPEIDKKFVDIEKFNVLLKLKNRIDDVTKKGNYDTWSTLIKINNPYENVPHLDNNRKINRAFYKLLEIHNKFDIVSKERTNFGFVCESPGGFIECARYINLKNFKQNDFYFAQSLKESECRFCNKIKDYTKIYYGPDNSGDILKVSTIKDYIFKVSHYNKCDVVTGDGGFDVSKDYIKQEQFSFRLIFCQLVVGMGSLKKGGDFICKIFESYTLPTIELIFILKKYFENVYIFKPLISRPCNSERYIIAKKFKSIDSEDFNKLLEIVEQIQTKNVLSFGLNIPDKFIKDVYKINNSFISDQIESFNKVFQMYDSNINNQQIKMLKEIHDIKCNDYLNRLL